MAKDPMAARVSKPDGGVYESSEEIRAKDAEKAAAKEVAEEVVEEEAPKKAEPAPEPEPPATEGPPASVRVQRIRDSQK